MGLFDRRKKNIQDEKADNTQGPAGNAPCADNNRRFTFLVQDTFQLTNRQGVVVVGFVRGTMQVEDAVYILHPGNQVTLASINGLELKADGQMKKLSSATDTFVSVLLSGIGDKSQVQKYALLTSIRPQPAVDVNTAVENPYVLGLSCEYGRFHQDPEFLNLLIGGIVHGHYLVPVFFGKEPEPTGNGKAVFTEGSTLSFPALSHPSDEGKSVFPIFTDWNELNKWPSLFNEQRPAKTMIFCFPECSTFATEKNSGLVINPFGQNPLFFPDTMIENIKRSEAYRQEFETNPEEQVQHVTVEKDTRVLLGVPRETNEERLIREAIASYGKRNDSVNAIYLLLKIDENNEKVYFCVLDSSQEDYRSIFGEIYKEVKPFANEIPIFEFSGRGEIAGLEKHLTEDALVYRKCEK